MPARVYPKNNSRAVCFLRYQRAEITKPETKMDKPIQAYDGLCCCIKYAYKKPVNIPAPPACIDIFNTCVKPIKSKVTPTPANAKEEKYGGKLEFIPDPDKMIEATLAHIDKKRADLGLPEYDADRFGQSGDTRMLELEKLPLAERRESIYGAVAK